MTQFFDRLPHLTRHIYSLLGEYFEDPSRNARTQRICVAFPNQLAIAQDGQPAPDPWESFLMYLKYCLQGTQYLIERSNYAATWVNHYDSLMQQLSIVRSILPRVKISAAGQSYENLIEMSQLLVNYQDIFWESYKSFLTSQVTDSDNLGVEGIEMVQCVERALAENNALNFVAQVNSARAGNSHHLLCYNAEAYLVPENIRGLKTVIDDITATLTSVIRLNRGAQPLQTRLPASF